jgi:hypothetical protein
MTVTSAGSAGGFAALAVKMLRGKWNFRQFVKARKGEDRHGNEQDGGERGQGGAAADRLEG